ETLPYNDRRALALFKNRNGAELSDGEEKIVNRTNKDNRDNSEEISLALAIEANIKQKNLTQNQQEILKKYNAEKIKTLTKKQKNYIIQYTNNNQKRNEALSLALAIEANIKQKDLTQSQQEILKKHNAENIKTLTDEQKTSIAQYRNNYKKRHEALSLALAIETNIKQKDLTQNQQEILKKHNAENIKTLTDEQKTSIAQCRNNHQKQYERLKCLANILKENKYDKIIEAYNNRIIQAGDTEKAGKLQREQECFQETWKAFLQTKKGKKFLKI